jgi:hypothetical protein
VTVAAIFYLLANFAAILFMAIVLFLLWQLLKAMIGTKRAIKSGNALIRRQLITKMMQDPKIREQLLNSARHHGG